MSEKIESIQQKTLDIPSEVVVYAHLVRLESSLSDLQRHVRGAQCALQRIAADISSRSEHAGSASSED